MSIETNKRIFYSPKKAVMFVLEEAVLLAIIVYLIYRVLGMQLYNGSVLFFQVPALPQNILWLATLSAFFVVIYFGIARRDPLVSKIHKEFSSTLAAGIKEKTIQTDRYIVALVLAEFVFVIMLAIAIFIYLDPDINVLPASVPWWAKLIGFAAWIAFGYFIYSKTREYRRKMYGPSLTKKAVFKEHDRQETRRVTNLRTGSIRIASKHHYDKLKSYNKKNSGR